MNLVPEALAPLYLLVLAIVGRVVLSWLPPGTPGGRALRDLPATWAASLLLGLAALPIIVGTSATWTSIGIAVLAASAVLRWMSRPLKLTPRHEPPLEREPASARAALALAWVATIAVLLRQVSASAEPHGSSWISATLVLALAALVDWALEIARCRAFVRAAAIAALGAAILCAPTRLDDSSVLAAVFFAAGAACTIAWYRRGDRRSLTLAAVFFATTILVATAGWLLASAGALVLVLGTASPSRRTALITCAVPIALAGALRLGAPPRPESDLSATVPAALYALIGILFLAVIVARFWDLRRIRWPAFETSGAAVGHERAMLLRTLLFALVFAWAARALQLEVRADFVLLPALFVLVVLFGSSLQRLAGRA